MIDWISASAPMTKRLFQAVLAADTKGLSSIWARVKTPYGSFKTVVDVETRRMSWDISPMKYLVGHNLFGTNNLGRIVLGVLKLIYKRHGLTFTERDAAFYTERGVLLSRVDVNGCFLVGSQTKVVETMDLLREHLLTMDTTSLCTKGQTALKPYIWGRIHRAAR